MQDGGRHLCPGMAAGKIFYPGVSVNYRGETWFHCHARPAYLLAQLVLAILHLLSVEREFDGRVTVEISKRSEMGAKISRFHFDALSAK